VAVFLFGFLLVGIERLMHSERWPGLNPIRRQWHFWTPKAKAYVRSAPGTFTYLFILVITTWVLQTSSQRMADQLLLARSTNLRHLVSDPMRVLFGSAFWVSDTSELFLSILLFALFAANAERWLGTGRTVVLFFVGHVGATLSVALWLWASLNFTVVRSPITNAQDVGSSYGFAALAGILVYRISRPKRWFYLLGIVAVAGINLAIEPSFTNWGHLIALGIGLTSYFIIPSGARTT
jgi:hypothetical protein